MLTLLEVCRVRWGVGLAEFIRESGYSRSHVLRVRNGDIEPSRDFIAAAISALRHLTLQDVRPDEVFELTTETSGAWPRQRQRQIMAAARAWKRDRKASLSLLQKLRGSPASEWGTTIGTPSANVVRALLCEARAVFDRVPAYAETLATVALGLVDNLLDPDLRPAYRKALRANAALERANALRQIGRLPDALAALTVAEESSEGEPECTHILGRAWLCRGSILFKMGRLSDADLWLRRSINLFAAVDDQLRVAKVRATQGGVLFERGAYELARDTWLSSIPALSAGNERHTLAIVWLNLGWCETELGDVHAAKHSAGLTREAFAKLRSDIEEIRSRWCEARLTALYGSRDDGVRALVEISRAFAARDLHFDAGMVDLDIVEALLIPPAREQLAMRVARGLVSVFTKAGASRETRKALAYLLDASPEGVRRTDVSHVRAHLKRTDREPDAKFEPPTRPSPTE